MPIVVRRLRPEDADTFRHVRLAALKDSPAAFGSTYAKEQLLTDDEWAGRARLSAGGSERAMFFALDGETVVGLVGGCRPDGAAPEVELISMWTDPCARRTGVGRSLVNAVVDWAKAIGAEKVDLWVARGNAAAESLYRASGFAETGDYQALPSDPCRDEVRMSLTL